MDADRFDTFTRALTITGSRRRALAALSGVLGGVLGAATFGAGAAKKKKCPPCRKPTKGTCKGKKPTGTPCPGGTCQRGSCVSTVAPPPAPPPPDPVSIYQCPGPKESTFIALATARFAQTFTASRSGSLRQIQVQVYKNGGTAGHYLVELLAVTAGTPTNSVMASFAIPDAAVPVGYSTLTATFSGPALVEGTAYAVAVSRPGGNDLGLDIRLGNDCAGLAFSQNPRGGATAPFQAVGSEYDLIAFVGVLP